MFALANLLTAIAQNPLMMQIMNIQGMIKELAKGYLETGMFKDDPQAKQKAKEIVDILSSHDLTKSHGRHLPTKTCIDMGLKIIQIEDNADLQDTILSIHHASALTITNTPVFKIIEMSVTILFLATYE